jgi:hypothetical protein
MKYPLRVGTDCNEARLTPVPDSELEGIEMQSMRIHIRARTLQRRIRWITHVLDA